MARYQKIHSQIWHDEKFITLSDDARLLFFYLLSSPHSNSIGIYVLPKSYAISDLNWTEKRFTKPFHELLGKELVLYDETVRLVCLPNHCKHNSLENENQAKAAAKIIYELPKSSLFSHILELFDKPFHKQLLEQLREQYAKPETEAEAETETEAETEKSIGTPDKPARPVSQKNLTDEEFIQALKTNPAYQGIDIPTELGRMDAWLLTPKGRRRKKTRAFVVNWINRVDKPMQGGEKDGTGKHTGLADKNYRAGTEGFNSG